MGQTYVAEVSPSMHGWLVEPTVLQKDHRAAQRARGGRPRRLPRLAAKSAKATRIDRLCTYSSLMRDQPWVDYHIKDGHKGPIVWRVRAARFRLNISHEPDGRRRDPRFALPSAPRWLIQAYNPLTGETKYFVSNAPAGVPIERLLHVAFSRWHIERGFRDEKDQLGLDQFECRRYLAVQRHLILTAISHLLLARLRLKLIDEGQQPTSQTNTPPTRPGALPGAGKKILTVPQVRRAADASIQAASLAPQARRKHLHRTAAYLHDVQHRNAKARRSHRRQRIRRLHRLGIFLKSCRCCIPPDQ